MVFNFFVTLFRLSSFEPVVTVALEYRNSIYSRVPVDRSLGYIEPVVDQSLTTMLKPATAGQAKLQSTLNSTVYTALAIFR